MDTGAIAKQLVEAAQSNPDLISNLTSNPEGLIKSVTGADLTQNEMSEVMAAATSLFKGEELDMGNIAGLAADLFSKHGGDLTKIAGSLFGAGDDGTDAAADTAKEEKSDGGIDLGGILNVAESLLGGK